MTPRGGYHFVHGLLMQLPSRIKKPLRRQLETVLPKPQYYLVSYPKSGRTWLRMMIGVAALHQLKIEHHDPTDLETFARRSRDFPTIRITHDTESSNISPDQVRFRPELYRQSRILFLARDPRDVLASFFHHQKNRRAFEADMPVFAHPDEMVEAESGGLRTMIRFYNVWADHFQETPDWMLVHYEDLKSDPAREVRRCLEFLGLEGVSDESISTGIEQGRFSKMQAKERAGQFSHPRLQPADPNNVASFKVRKGVIGGYAEEFSPAAIERMETIIAAELSDAFARYKYSTKERQSAKREPGKA